MKKIELTQNKFALVDDEYYDKLNQHNWYYHNRDYAVRKVHKKTILMHRVIMNPSDNIDVDHKDGDGLNNQKENLRICTRTQNAGNSKISKKNTSGIKGVYWNKRDRKWIAQIGISSKVKNLGSFNNKLDAKNAYIKTAKQYFGEFYSERVM